MQWRPGSMLSTFSTAKPVRAFTAAVPIRLPSTKKDGRPVVPTGITVAVIFTFWLKTDGLWSVETLVDELDRYTSCEYAGDGTLLLKQPSPLYLAVIAV